MDLARKHEPADPPEPRPGSAPRQSGVWAAPSLEVPPRPVRISLLAGAPIVPAALPPGVELVDPDHPGPINARILDAGASHVVLAEALARAAREPASVGADGIVAPPVFFCGAAPLELAADLLRAEAQAVPPLTAASLDVLLPVAVARGASHAEIDVLSRLDWASGTLGRWAASHHPGHGLSQRERTILGLRLLEIDRRRMASLLVISERRLGKAISTLIQKLGRPDLESAVGRLIRLFAARPLELDGRPDPRSRSSVLRDSTG